MFDFGKISETQLVELKTMIRAGVEKSEFDKYYLFTLDRTEKTKIYAMCFRFLSSAHRLTDEPELKIELTKEIRIHEPIIKEVRDLQLSLDTISFRKEKRIQKMQDLLNRQEVNDIIDLFSILTEKVNMIDTARLKGIVLEGQSDKEFQKVFKGKKEFKSI